MLGALLFDSNSRLELLGDGGGSGAVAGVVGVEA
jgi:hypothetical protein